MASAKTKQSVYLIVKKDGSVVTVNARKDLLETIEEIKMANIEKIYRAQPMVFQKVTTTRLLSKKSKPKDE